MDFYPSCAIKSLLKCAYCEAKFTFAVKLIPDCGFSICSRCYEELKESIVIKSGEYECRACKRWHTMSSQGLADNLLAMEILKVRPEERALPDQALKLRALLDDARSHLDRFAKFSGVDEVNRHCERLKDEIVKAVEARVDQIRKVGDDFLREVDDYRAGLAASSSEPPAAKRLKKTDEFAQIAADVQRFDAEWGEYFTRISKVVSEADLERAHEEAKSLGPRIEELERRTRSEAFGGRVLEWKESALVLFEKHQIGELVYDCHSTTTTATAKSRATTAAEVPTSTNDETSWPPVESTSPSSPVSSPSVSSLAPRASSHSDKTAAFSMRVVSTLIGPSKSINHITFLVDGRPASCYGDKVIKVWRKGDHEAQLHIPLKGMEPLCLASLKADLLAVGCADGSIQVWDLASRELLRTLTGHTDRVFSMRVLADASLASISADDSIKVWNPYTTSRSSCLASMSGHGSGKGPETELGLLSTGLLLSCSIDQTYKDASFLRLWDPAAGLLAKSVAVKYPGISAVLVLADDTLALGFLNGRVRLFDLSREVELRVLQTRVTGKIYSMAQLPSGDGGGGALVVSSSTRLSVVDVDKDALVESTETSLLKKPWAIRLSPDGRHLASAGDTKIRLWTRQPSSSSS